jgi:hypothetical protein
MSGQAEALAAALARLEADDLAGYLQQMTALG